MGSKNHQGRLENLDPPDQLAQKSQRDGLDDLDHLGVKDVGESASFLGIETVLILSKKRGVTLV